MKTITKKIKVYEFAELSDSAKDKVRQWIYEGMDYLGQEVGETVNKFERLFPINVRQLDYEETYRNDIRFEDSNFSYHAREAIETMTGPRLATYIYNNYLSRQVLQPVE